MHSKTRRTDKILIVVTFHVHYIPEYMCKNWYNDFCFEIQKFNFYEFSIISSHTINRKTCNKNLWLVQGLLLYLCDWHDLVVLMLMRNTANGLKNICLDISLLHKDIHLFGANMWVILDVPYCSIPADINPFQHLHMVCTLMQYIPWHKPLPTPTHGLYPTAVYPLT